MIINNLDAVKHTKSQQPQRAQMTAPRVIITPKEVNMKDFLFHYPIFKPSVAFGANKPQKVTTFEDSLTQYCPPELKLDRGQKDAMASLYSGATTVLTAPTGTGKTLVADYVIQKNLAEGRDSIYTTPTKALANEKYKDACAKFGKENVGLLTGDIKVNKHAPVQIVTAEIYLNKLMGESPKTLAESTKNLATVIHDENHTMNDPERGIVYEMSIIHTPPHVQQLALSATVGNDQKVVDWFNDLLVEGKKTSGVNAVPEANLVHVDASERHVPFKVLIYDEDTKKLTPLMVEKYSLAKIKQAALPGAKEPLFDKQREVLEDISRKAGGDGSVGHGVETLSGILKNRPEAELETMEEALVKNLGFEAPEAMRTAALLSDKSQRKFNPDLEKTPETVAIAKKAKNIQKSSKPIAPKKIVSPARLKSLFETNAMPESMTLALAKLGNGVPKSGLHRILDLAKANGNKDMNPDSFRKMLMRSGVKRSESDFMTKIFTTKTFAPKEPSPVMDLVAVLDRENKTPLMCVQFSKRGCDELHHEFLESGQSLLTDEEKQSVKDIIKKNHAQGNFLGAREKEDAFLSGTAVHHSGKLPGYKAVVEELAASKLAKVTFSTDTLGVGINFPVRTVVFNQLSKYAGVNEKGEPDFRTITANELHQIMGRAGRRGKDAIGYAIFHKDKEHTVKDIYDLVTAPSDNLKSNFKPLYRNVTSLVGMAKTTANVEAIVDKSFLRKSLDPTEVNVEAVVADTKTEFKQMAKVLTHPELGCFSGEEGNLAPTLKGSIVAKARGVNELAFAQMMLEAPLEKLSAPQLAAVACSLTEASDKHKALPIQLDETTTEFLTHIEGMKEKIKTVEATEGLASKEVPSNHYAAQFVQAWASSPVEDSQESWKKLVTVDMKKAKAFDEGDLFKAVNRTADIVQQIGETAGHIISNASSHPDGPALADRMRIVAETAQKALEGLKKSPMAELPFVDELKHIKK